MTGLGLTDPRTWPVSMWLADVVPHVAHGLVIAIVLHQLES